MRHLRTRAVVVAGAVAVAVLATLLLGEAPRAALARRHATRSPSTPPSSGPTPSPSKAHPTRRPTASHRPTTAFPTRSPVMPPYNPLLACSVDADCVAIPDPGCCPECRKVAVNQSETAAYVAKNKCTKAVPCPLICILDNRASAPSGRPTRLNRRSEPH